MPTSALLSLALGYALLIAAAMASRLPVMRVLVGLAAAVLLARAILVTPDRAGAFGAGLLLAVCLFMVARGLYERRRVAFTAVGSFSASVRPSPGPRATGAAGTARAAPRGPAGIRCARTTPGPW